MQCSRITNCSSQSRLCGSDLLHTIGIVLDKQASTLYLLEPQNTTWWQRWDTLSTTSKSRLCVSSLLQLRLPLLASSCPDLSWQPPTNMDQFVTSVNSPPPLDLSTDVAAHWNLWKEQWDNYAIVVQLADKSHDLQKAIFLNTIGAEAFKIYKSLDYPPAMDRKKLDTSYKSHHHH